MKRHFFIAMALLSALFLSSAVQSCRSCRKIITQATEIKKDIRKTVEENNKFMHLEFLGIPICGRYLAFADTLQKLGFEEYDRGPNFFMLTGTYQDKPVDVVLLATPKTRLVYRVSFLFQDRKTWAEVEQEYNRMKDSLTTLYGVPDSEECFEPPFKKGDGYEMKAIEKEMCNYLSDFCVYYGSARVGSLTLYIASGNEPSTAQVVLIYSDFYNNSIYDKEIGNTDSNTSESEPEPTDSDTTKTTGSATTPKDTTKTQ